MFADIPPFVPPQISQPALSAAREKGNPSCSHVDMALARQIFSTFGAVTCTRVETDVCAAQS